MEKIKEGESQKREGAGARKGRKVAIHYVFPMICGSGGPKSNLAKAAGPEPAGQMRDEKLHAVVAQSTFPSQNVQNTPFSDHSWKLSCRKRKSVKTPHFRTTFGSWDVEKVHAVVARSTFPRQKCKNNWGFRTTFGGSDVVLHDRRNGLCTLSKVSKTWRFCGSFNYNYNYNDNTLHYTTLHYTTLHYTTLHYTTLHYTTLYYTSQHSTTHHYTTPHYTTLHFTTLHYITLHYTPLHYTTPHYTTLHYTTRYTRLH